MQIGKHSIEGKAVLAPMAGISDMPFRQLCAELGASMVTGEMTSSNPALRNTLKSRLRTALPDAPFRNSLPRIVQIAGTEPAEMAMAAEYQVAIGAQIIDINMGCPAKKVCNKAAGSSLLKNERLVEQILKAVVARIEVPVTLKIRTGWDQHNKNALTIAKIAEQAGVAALTIHGRTRACKFRGDAEYDTIAEVATNVGIPVIANGDITDAEKARDVLEKTGAAAVMIGRAARGKPWIFSEINALLNVSHANCALFNGKSLNFNNAIHLQGLIIRHLQMIDRFYNCVKDDLIVRKNNKPARIAGLSPDTRHHQRVDLGVKIARKHICWYFDQLKHIIVSNNIKEKEGLAGSRSNLAKITAILATIDEARANFNRLESQPAQLDFIHSFFRDLPTTGDIAA